MSNETLDFALVAAQIAGGTASHGGTDSFNANNVRIYRDNSSSGTIGSWDAGDTLITGYVDELVVDTAIRSEEHTSELQSLMRISYAVFCLKKKNTRTIKNKNTDTGQSD